MSNLYSEPIFRQSQLNASDQRAYDKTMEKHRRVKQNVEALRAAKYAGRLLIKDENCSLSEKRFEKEAQSMTKPLEEEQIQLFFSNINHYRLLRTVQLEKKICPLASAF